MFVNMIFPLAIDQLRVSILAHTGPYSPNFADNDSPAATPTSLTAELPVKEVPPVSDGEAVRSEHVAGEPGADTERAPAPISGDTETQVELPVVDNVSAPPVSSLPSSHGTRPSMDHVVFGNTNQPQVLPSTNSVLGQTSAPFHPIPAPPPGFGAPSFPLPLHPPSQNAPAPRLPQWPVPTLHTGLTNGAHGHVTGSSQPYVLANGERQDGYNGQTASYAASTVASGPSRSHSQSPFKNKAYDVNHGSHLQDSADYTTGSSTAGVEPANIPSVPPSAPFMMAPRRAASRQPEPSEYSRGAVELASHIFAQMRRPEFVDLALKVRRGDTLLLDVPAHRIVVARSTKISNALLENVRQNGPSHVVDLATDSMFVTTESLAEVTKFLYGAPLLTVESFLARLEPFQSQISVDARHRMQNAISFAATGHFLDIYSVHARGMEIAKALLRWDTLEMAVDYAWTACHQAGKHRLVAAAPENREEAFAAQLLEQDIVEFIACNLPRGFRLDTSAKELRSAPRLPIPAERPSHNPRLSQIRFGDVPPEDDARRDIVTQTLSSILLSMPLRILASIFNHPAAASQLKWRGSDRTYEEVINERERRREETLNRYRREQSSLRLGSDPNQPGLVYNLLWKEYIRPSPQHPSGYDVSESQIDSL